FVTSLSPEAETRKLIAHHLPHYNFTGDRVIGINDLVHSRALPGILWIVVLSMISYAIGQFCMSTSPLITLYVVRPYRKYV
ncbi:hypothetical protein PENTCL1PPCAC_10303, partial [Pristionchus entomophagus]